MAYLTEMPAWFGLTLLELSRLDQEPEPLDLTAFRSMIITHVLIGRIQNLNDEDNTPYVYATVYKDNKMIWRTYSAQVKLNNCRVFVSERGADIATAANERRDDLEVCQRVFVVTMCSR